MAFGVITGTVVAKSGVTLMARVLGNNGRPITRASLSAITYHVYNVTDAEDVSSGSGSLTIADVVFDDLQQNDPRWTKDAADLPGSDGRWGYNFLATLPASLFTAGGDRIQVDIKITPVSGEPFVQPFQFTPRTVYIS